MANTTFPVTAHEHQGPNGKVCTYEHGIFPTARNALVFIGGLGDGPHSVPYPRRIAAALASRPTLSYSVFEARLASSFAGWGHASLAEDVRDVSALVRYLRGTAGRTRVVLMGHSTGSQDCIEYTDYVRHASEPVDGFILQAPVSDREALRKVEAPERLRESLALAETMCREGRGDDYVPCAKSVQAFGRTPITAHRLMSLIAFNGGDDYFSSDLPDDKLAAVWGRIGQPVLIVPSGEDEHVPKTVDVEKMLARWKSFTRPGTVSELSGLIPGASHRAEPEAATEWLVERVVMFLEEIGRLHGGRAGGTGG